MGMALAFHVIENGKVIRSSGFKSRMSPMLMDRRRENGLSIFQDLFIICSYDAELLYAMNADSFDTGNEERELEVHEGEYEPFDENWKEKKKSIQNIIEKKKIQKDKMLYPKVKHVGSIFKDILKLVESEDKRILTLSDSAGYKLKDDYPILDFKTDLTRLIAMINNSTNEELRICWNIM